MFPSPLAPDNLWSFSVFCPVFSLAQGYFYANALNKSFVEYVLSIKLSEKILAKRSLIIHVTEAADMMESLVLHCKEMEHGKALRVQELQVKNAFSR